MKCVDPVTFKGQLVPCRNCLACRRAKAREWTARVFCESDLVKRGAFFITLTYNDKALDKHGDRNLHMEDVQAYVKRIRKNLGFKSADVKFIITGEYGEKHARPHYHLLVIGIPFDNNNYSDYLGEFGRCWTDFQFSSFVKIEPVRSLRACVYYVTSYCLKCEGKYARHVNESAAQFTRRTGLVPPFTCFSQGFGLSYFEKNKDTIFDRGYLSFGEDKFAIPNYFLRKLKLSMNDDEYALHVTSFLSKLKKELLSRHCSKSLSLVEKLDKLDVSAVGRYMRATFLAQNGFCREWAREYRRYKSDYDYLMADVVSEESGVRARFGDSDERMYRYSVFFGSLLGDTFSTFLNFSSHPLAKEARKVRDGLRDKFNKIYLDYDLSSSDYYDFFDFVRLYKDASFLFKDKFIQAGLNVSEKTKLYMRSRSHDEIGEIF